MASPQQSGRLKPACFSSLNSRQATHCFGGMWGVWAFKLKIWVGGSRLNRSDRFVTAFDSMASKNCVGINQTYDNNSKTVDNRITMCSMERIVFSQNTT